LCSIHNELGDRFTYKKGDDLEDFDLIETYYPFNINIACVGRFGQGKSAGVNAILQEYKAKESSKGCSQTKELTFYQVTNQPIKLLDIPGFESV
jgi:GTP-binding protein EngB required for normal cell division